MPKDKGNILFVLIALFKMMYRTPQDTDGQKHSTKIQSPLVGGYNFCFDCVCTQASSPNRGYRGWSHTMTFPLWGLGVRSTEPQLETVKVLETCGCDIPQKCSHGMSYVQIFTSSMFAIKNDGITSFPFSSSCCCHWAKSHLTLWLSHYFFPSIVLVIQPVNHIKDSCFESMNYRWWQTL